MRASGEGERGEGGAVADLAAFLRTAASSPGGLLVVTGAGVSRASGIATFRGAEPGAVWARDVTTLGTFAYFEDDPVGSWRWYLERFDGVLAARPNAAHRALVAIEARFAALGAPFLLATQNVDPLHERAGSSGLVKVHGSADRVRCTTRGCAHAAPLGSLPRPEAALAAFRRAPGEATLPRCPGCGGLLRQHVLWFDERYDSHADYQFHRVLAAADAASAVLFVGTSFAVGATDAVLSLARRRGAALRSIDPSPSPPPRGVTPHRAPAEGVLPAAVEAFAPGRGDHGRDPACG